MKTSSGQTFANAYTPAETRKYEENIATFAAQAVAGRPLLLDPVVVGIEAVFAVPDSWPNWKRAEAAQGRVWPTTKPDTDNVIKAVLDALNGVVWKDDVQVVWMTVRKLYGERPGLAVEVNPIPGLTAQAKRKGGDDGRGIGVAGSP